MIEGVVVVTVGTVGTGATVVVGRSPSVARVVKDPPPPSNMAVVMPGTVVVTVGTGATVGRVGATAVTGVTMALKGILMVIVDGGAVVGTRVVTLNPAGVTAGGVVMTGNVETDGDGMPNRELSRT